MVSQIEHLQNILNCCFLLSSVLIVVTHKQYRNPVKMAEMKEMVDEVTDLEEQLQELYEEANRMIEEGEEDTARELIEANYEVLVEQFESGYKSMEQAAMLDILAQLRMSLGDFEEAEDLLGQVIFGISTCDC